MKQRWHIYNLPLIKGVALLVLCAFSNISAQEFTVDVTSYNWEDGLPHRQINATAKDESGFLWIATRAGVSRFDGYNFKNINYFFWLR